MTMKPESLEGLLIDRALGELSPEVTELLDAYLQANPAAAEQAAAWTETWRGAVRATAFDVEGRLQPLPKLKPRGSNTWNWRIRRGELLRLAACLIIGVTAAWGLFTAQPEKAPAPAVASQPSKFWSVNRLKEIYSRPSARKHRPMRHRLPWGSPLRIQKGGESYGTSIR
ncbi:MAG: hypothetical protein OXH06_17705 [Gemmatimonadetes bacterium]|nr:hypothetical protein [Gemmatimonadota bacterium]